MFSCDPVKTVARLVRLRSCPRVPARLLSYMCTGARAGPVHEHGPRSTYARLALDDVARRARFSRQFSARQARTNWSKSLAYTPLPGGEGKKLPVVRFVGTHCALDCSLYSTDRTYCSLYSCTGARGSWN